MRTRKRYIPIAEAATGMVLAEDVRDVYRRTYQPAGLELSDENLRQLAANHAEFICVQVPDERSDAELADDIVRATQRVHAIFQGADLSHPMTAALMHQVLQYRST